MKSLAEAQVGQVLSFIYYGGSNPGTQREAEVLEVHADRILGQDLAKGEPRNYLFDKATMIEVVGDCSPEVVVAEAACDVENTPSDTRIKTTRMPFQSAREALHQNISELNGEELSEVLAEVEGFDGGKFDAASGEVVLEQVVQVPHCTLNLEGDVAGINWVNEDGDILTTVTTTDNDRVYLSVDGEEATAEQAVSKLSQHLGLTPA